MHNRKWRSNQKSGLFSQFSFKSRGIARLDAQWIAYRGHAEKELYAAANGHQLRLLACSSLLLIMPDGIK